ncbi:hypothetical protein ACWC2K_38650 [Streptomyces chattanoogensis]
MVRLSADVAGSRARSKALGHRPPGRAVEIATHQCTRPGGQNDQAGHDTHEADHHAVSELDHAVDTLSAVGVRLSSVHFGQVSQPSPNSVSRTARW